MKFIERLKISYYKWYPYFTYTMALCNETTDFIRGSSLQKQPKGIGFIISRSCENKGIFSILIINGTIQKLFFIVLM